MSTDASGSLERAPTTDSTDLPKRTRRALEEFLTVLDDVDEVAGADELYAVVSESGSQYIVDARAGSCTCPDAEHRDPEDGCKHARRVAYSRGEQPIPAAADPDAVDDQLGAHVDGPVRWACEHGRVFCAESASAREDAVRCSDCAAETAVTDGGVIVDSADDSPVLGEDEDGRPDDCDCGEWNEGLGLPCWPCYHEGFETPASADGEDAR